MSKFSRSVLITSLLVIMSFTMVPVEFMHSFYDHKDTDDGIENPQISTIETSHRHCFILKIEFREYLVHPKQQFAHVDLEQGSLRIHYLSPLLVFEYSVTEQRGPPIQHSFIHS